MKLSFCTTCMGRLHHLQETLLPNLITIADLPGAEWILLNYNSPDGLGRWVKERLIGFVEQGTLSYYTTLEPNAFHMSHAKNVSHLLATGDIVCNVDADTFLSRAFCDFVQLTFANRLHKCFLGQTETCDLSGRIAISKQNFMRLGGYNEDFSSGWGYDDHDFRIRARLLGLQSVCFNPECERVIKHSDLERVRYTLCASIQESHDRHVAISETSLARGEIVANRNRCWGSATVTHNFDEYPIRVGYTLV